jgi:pSer/pThr/pTyr-binding forkhead associated (FHA) protein
MWKLTIQDDQATKTVVHLVRDEYTLGRDEGNAVRLTERNISRRHARLAKQAEEWRLHDLTSYNGCYVNGARVAEPQKLMHGDLIQLGDYRLTLEDEALSASGEDGVLTLPGRPGMHTQSDRLVLIAGPGQGQEFVLATERLVIGRGEECEVSVNHPSVSRVHAEIRRAVDGRWEIVDLSSANGIRVNGSELPNSLLDSRDVIELGDVVLKYLPAGEIYIPGPEEALRLDRGAHGKQGLPFWLKLAVVLALAAGAAVLVMVLRTPPAPPAPIARSEGTDPIGQLLKDARTLLAKGDVEGAMRRASGIPESSNLRASNDFRAIQDAWADSLFDKTAKTSDPSEKRVLLDRIAATPSVDPARRKRAADELEALTRAAVDITELPSDEEETSEAAVATSEPSAKKAATTAAKPAPAVAPKKAPTATPAAAKTSTSSGSLVRKNPFGGP